METKTLYFMREDEDILLLDDVKKIKKEMGKNVDIAAGATGNYFTTTFKTATINDGYIISVLKGCGYKERPPMTEQKP